MTIIPYGDYSFTVTIHNAHLTTQWIHLTFSQRGYKIVDLTEPTVLDDEHCVFKITQRQTSVFNNDDEVEIQPNLILANGDRKPLVAKKCATGKQLYKRIIGEQNG